MLCKDGVYDIIFLDIEMPEMNGYETAQAVRMLSNQNATVYIVALSGSLSSAEHVKKCLAHGMNDCIAKPLNEAMLKQRMPKWNFLK